MKLGRIAIPVVGTLLLAATNGIGANPAAAAAPLGVALPMTTVAALAADDVNARVFLSGGPGSSAVLVADRAGVVTNTLTSEPGVTDLVLTPDSSALYLARTDDGVIAQMDPGALNEVRTFATGGCPENLALDGNRLWFSTSCGTAGWLGSVNLTTGGVTHYFAGVSQPLTDLAVSSAAPDRLLSIALATGDTLSLYDTSGPTPNLLAARSVGASEQIVITPNGQNVMIGHSTWAGTLSMADLTVAPYVFDGGFGLAATPGSDGLLVVGVGQGVVGVDATWQQRHSYGLPSGYTVVRQGVALSADSSQLYAVGDGPGGLRLFPLADPRSSQTVIDARIDGFRTHHRVNDTILWITGLHTIDDGAGVWNIPDASISVTRTDAQGTKDLGVFTTNSSGEFTFTDTPVSRGRVTFQFSYAGTSTLLGQVATASVDVLGVPAGVNVSAEPALYGHPDPVTIHVRRPIVHRWVTVYATESGGSEDRIRRVHLSNSGNARFSYRFTRFTKIRVSTTGDPLYAPGSATTAVRVAPLLAAVVARATSHRGTHYRVPTTVNPLLLVRATPHQSPKICALVVAEARKNRRWVYIGHSTGCIHFAGGRRAGAVYVGDRFAGLALRFQWSTGHLPTSRSGVSRWVYVTFY
jgi:hypothetical protein